MKRVIGCFIIGILLFSACRNQSGGVSEKGTNDTVTGKLEAINQQLKDGATNPDLYLQRARIYIANRDFDLALKDLRQAISLDPKKPEFYVTLSDIYLLLGQPDNCRENLLKAIDLNPEQTDARLKLAKLYLIIKNYPDCFATVQELLAIDQANAGAYYTRALALLEKGDTIAAVKDLQKAVENKQDFYDAYLQLGELYAIRKDPLAELYLKNALNIKPASREALYMLAMYYQESSQFPRAITTYEILRKTDTTFREAPYNMGYIYLVYLQDFRRAVSYFSQAIQLDPGYFQAYFNRGYAYELAGDFKKAREDYEKTLKIEVNYDKAITGLNRLDKIQNH